MLNRLRERAGSEKGFTLIELLVVMLILGILAAIAIPAFLNQKSKASDSAAKVEARTMQTAMETCSTDNNTGTYAGCNIAALRRIEPTISAGATVVGVPTATNYVVRSATSSSNNWFQISKTINNLVNPPTVTVVRACTNANTGGCQVGATW